MNIISWNVNGLRAVYKKGALNWLIEKSPNIFCFQETKAHPDQLPEEVRNPQGYFSYFDHSKTKKGYSGVAIYTKIKPEKVEYGMGVPEFDQEGRMLVAYFKNFVLLNVYFPNGGGGPVRLDYKLKYYDHFLAFIDKLHKSGKKIVFCGDVNTAHEEIDLARPKENEKNTGFLPVERAWLNKVVSHKYVDVFRHFNPDKKDAYTYWDMKTFARDRNVGWRIDYFFVSSDFLPKVKGIKILDGIFGSDHCPVELTIS
ncbi:MAG: exodeoxyribonuclease III [Parcubacteria group bacterium]|nr:exodeoxyribonuclease III [Parcubacteria group bacterium]